MAAVRAWRRCCVVASAVTAISGLPTACASSPAGFAADDECNTEGSEGVGACAANALQRSVARRSADASHGSCKAYGCSGYVHGRPCQCTSACAHHGNCCKDYHALCTSGGGAGQTADQGHHTAKSDCYQTTNKYALDWQAAGSSFFDHFTFVTQDDVHGAHQFTTSNEAWMQRTATTSGGQAQLRFGGLRTPSYVGEAYKRYAVNIHTNKAWSPTPGFIAALHYSRLPHGCGIWPSFWAMNSDKVWPGGGELDILEYANDETNKVTFHIASKCFLDGKEAARCAPHGHNTTHAEDCETSYFEGKLGCMPKQKQPTGKYFAENPGIVLAEWTEHHVTIFHIPEAEIPEDIKNDKPDPSSWGRWVLAHLPFKQGCAADIGPQELVLNMQLCGDWPGATWDTGHCPYESGLYNGHGCETGLSSPSDCCTKFVTNPMDEMNLRYHQYMDIKSLKVYTANGEKGKDSGTFARGGVPLTDVPAEPDA